MRSMKFVTLSIAAAAICLISSTAANAQATRTWVSGVGDDVTPCSRTAPCKTFAGAISKTAAGGEINVLDDGSYGAVTITKSITIDAGGNLAAILASLTNGIIVNAGANDRVILRNLKLNGIGTGLNGIRFLAGNQLIIENCGIYGFTQNGIDVAKSAGGTVFIRDTEISNVANGIRVNTSSGTVTATIDRVRIEGAGTAGISVGTGFAQVISSTIANSGNAIHATAAGSVINVENSTMSFNSAGVNASVSGSVVRLFSNAIYNNTNGISIAPGATVASDGSNRVIGNGATQSPNAPLIKQ